MTRHSPPPPARDTEESLLARASLAGWIAWLRRLLDEGWDRLAAFGLVVVLGFLTGVGALWAFGELAEGVLNKEVDAMDAAAGAALRTWQSPQLDFAARGVSTLGNEALWVFVALLGLYLLRRHRLGAGMALVVVVVGAQLLNNVLKDVFQRTRPSPITSIIAAQVYSFPSGHAMVSAAFYSYVAYLSWRLLDGRARIAWTIVLGLVVLLIGASRIYLGVHYLSDVLAGYVAGFIWTDAVVVGGTLLTRRRPLHASGHEVTPPGGSQSDL